jgi:hypothetical protein
MLRYQWSCKCCGRQHDELPLDWTAKAPDHYLAIPEAERTARTQLSKDFCRIDDNAFYVRGAIEIPIVGRSDTLAWGVWASVSAASAKTIWEVWDAPDCASTGPFFGWLSSALRLYPDTFNLKTYVHLRAEFIPLIELEPTDHPLAVEQRNGITVDRVVEIAEALLPRH